ncbi:nuclear transport factor 2 family protein [Rubrivivax sp. RP6-9]|uniref:nuclear transport factor 2 family protein n=1 Tax=Rubrivivax sp. RP6-9 TaxID=3415750 RepID=UPI003CC50A0D
MRTFLHACLLALVLASPAHAVAPSEVDDVMVPLKAYLEGHATGQEAAFRRAFAADAVLIGHRDDAYRKGTVDAYIARAAGGRSAPDEAQRRRWIASVHVTGRVATAVIELRYPGMHALDHMTLVRFADGWRIVVKAYDAVTPPARVAR